MKRRINIQRLEPKAYKAMFTLEDYLKNTGLNPTLKELIKIRASQINGCDYCIDLHTGQALRKGETDRRLFALSAWKESPLFTEEERSALAMTEEITCIQEHGLTETTYQKAREFFSKHEVAQIIMQIGTINLWNRIAVSSHLFHDS